MTTPRVDSGAGTGGLSTSGRTLTLGLCVAVVAVAFEAVSVATAMPAAARDLDGLDLYAWAFSLFVIGQLFTTVAGGRVCDRIGPARPMAFGLALFAVGLVVAATAPTMLQLVAGRLLQGLGSGVIAISLYVIIAQAFDERHRATMFSYISSAWILPSFLGPPAAAWLTHHLGWRSVFWGVLPLVALGALIMLPPVRRFTSDPPVREGADRGRPAALWAAGLAAVGTAGVQFAGQQLSPLGVAAGLVGLLMVGVALPNLMPSGFFRFGQGLPPVILVRGLMAGAFFGAETFMPLMLVEQRGLSLLLAGASLSVGSLGWSLGAWIQSRPSARIRRDQLITLGAVSVLLGVVLVALVARLELWVGWVGVAWVLGGIGMGLSTASTSVATMTLSHPGQQGRNSASLQFGEAFGAGLFIGLGGTIFAALHPSGDLAATYFGVLIAMSGVGLLAVVVSLRVGPLRGPAAATESTG